MKTEKNILIAFILNILFAIFELFGGILTNSIAIISDAVHDFGDSLSIGISYFLEKKSKQKPNEIYTYGYLRYSLIGALITTIILLVSSFLIIINASSRIFNPVTVNYNGMFILAIFGFLTNLTATYFTNKGESLNQKAVNLHMLEDCLGWLAVLIVSIIIKYTNIYILDPIISILVSIFILINSLKNINSILNIFLEKIPNNISIPLIKEHLLKIDSIKDIHHIHIWSMDGINNYATMHIVSNNKDIKKKVREELKEHGINHVTIELESEEDECLEASCNINIKKNTHHHH